MIVDTTAGKVEGLEHAGILQFRGVPFAQADRFCAPEPRRPWTGILDATEFGPVAPQSPSPTESLLGVRDETYSEDCLVLNVFTPAADDARRPVMVWIHGGGFVSGAGSRPYYNATNLVLHGDVVVVTINYRLGALGFLHLGELLPDFAGASTNGIRDQIAALGWVRDNIAGFGGDPDQVTIFGESAGGMSVATLLGVPEAQGLFHGAIAQSGAAENLLRPDQAATVAERLLANLDLTPRQAEQLLDLDADQLVEAQAQIEAGLFSQRAVGDGGPDYLQLPFQPVVDGDLIPTSPLDTVRSGNAPGVPLVVGTTRDEWNLFAMPELGSEISAERLLRRAIRVVGEERAAPAVELYREARPEASNHALWLAMVTDRVFRQPAIHLAEAQLQHTPQVAMYRFDYASTSFGGLAGACHAIDVPFVFDNVHLRGVDLLLGGVDDATRDLGRRTARGWTTMATTGAPHHDDLDWPAYDTGRRATCVLDRSAGVVEDPEGEIRAFWNS
jgi:para-nitrobenzyl esterase